MLIIVDVGVPVLGGSGSGPSGASSGGSEVQRVLTSFDVNLSIGRVFVSSDEEPTKFILSGHCTALSKQLMIVCRHSVQETYKAQRRTAWLSDNPDKEPKDLPSISKLEQLYPHIGKDPLEANGPILVHIANTVVPAKLTSRSRSCDLAVLTLQRQIDTIVPFRLKSTPPNYLERVYLLHWPLPLDSTNNPNGIQWDVTKDPDRSPFTALPVISSGEIQWVSQSRSYSNYVAFSSCSGAPVVMVSDRVELVGFHSGALFMSTKDKQAASILADGGLPSSTSSSSKPQESKSDSDEDVPAPTKRKRRKAKKVIRSNSDASVSSDEDPTVAEYAIEVTDKAYMTYFVPVSVIATKKLAQVTTQSQRSRSVDVFLYDHLYD